MNDRFERDMAFWRAVYVAALGARQQHEGPYYAGDMLSWAKTIADNAVEQMQIKYEDEAKRWLEMHDIRRVRNG